MTQGTSGQGASRPAANAGKSEWVDHVVGLGAVDRATAEGMTKEQLVQQADQAGQTGQQGQTGQA
jgi:hypothetical protein